MIEPQNPNTIPSQWLGHVEKIATGLMVGTIAWYGKRFLENNALNEKISNNTDRKVISYALTVFIGGVLGGTFHGLDTDSIKGTKVGIVAGGIISLIGAGLTDARDFYEWVKGTSSK